MTRETLPPAWFDPACLETAQARRAWRSAKPTPYVVIDELVGPERQRALLTALGRELLVPQEDELFRFLGGFSPPVDPVLRSFHDALVAPSACAAVSTLAGVRIGSGLGRAFTYRRGDFLLPHSDLRPDDVRLVAFIYYLGHRGILRGGALEFFACRQRGGRIVGTRPALRIDPRPDRLVLFAVSPQSLHQVREVTQGTRGSLAGWFVP